MGIDRIATFGSLVGFECMNLCRRTTMVMLRGIDRCVSTALLQDGALLPSNNSEGSEKYIEQLKMMHPRGLCILAQ